MRPRMWPALGLLLAAVAVTGCASAEPGRFQGKYELVPLFGAGHRPVIKNGHQEYADRNTITMIRPNGERVTFFAGQTTDLASIPRIVWPLLPPDGPWAEAALPHDGCYASSGTFDWQPTIGHKPVGPLKHGRSRPAPYTRAECDHILLEGMVALQVPPWKRTIIYDAVRLFGGLGGWGK